MVRWARWCPNMYIFNHKGHAKNVVAKSVKYNVKKKYYCDICKSYFTLQELKSVNSCVSSIIKRRIRQRK